MSAEGESSATRGAGPEPGRRSLRASEAASIIGVSVATVRGWADQGRVPSHRTVGGHRRFDIDELRRWLAERGAPVPPRRRPGTDPARLPPCPRLARELNGRIEAVLSRVVGGYHPQVPTLAPRPSEGELRRTTTRFVRVVADALESGDPRSFTGRAEVAGYRGGLQGEVGADVIAHNTRLAVAVLQEAEEVVRAGLGEEALGMAALHAVIEHAQAAMARGFEMARGARGEAARG